MFQLYNELEKKECSGLQDIYGHGDDLCKRPSSDGTVVSLLDIKFSLQGSKETRQEMLAMLLRKLDSRGREREKRR
jgi:hypothetical protein